MANGVSKSVKEKKRFDLKVLDFDGAVREILATFVAGDWIGEYAAAKKASTASGRKAAFIAATESAAATLADAIVEGGVPAGWLVSYAGQPSGDSGLTGLQKAIVGHLVVSAVGLVTQKAKARFGPVDDWPVSATTHLMNFLSAIADRAKKLSTRK